MSDSDNSGKLNRRALLLGAVFLVGGAAALTRFARQSVASADSGPVFSPDQFALLEQVADVMHPAHRHARRARCRRSGIHPRRCWPSWGSRETQREILGVLDAIEKQAWDQFGAAFLEHCRPSAGWK